MMKRTIWGVVLIALGVMALLQSLEMYAFGLSFWPVVLTLIGGSILWSGLRKASWVQIALGLWVGAMGLFDILHAAGVTPMMDGGDIASKGWPLLLVAVGISVLFGKGVRIRLNRANCGRTWSIGDIRYGQNGLWRLDHDLEINRGIGDVKMDLTTAEIPAGKHRIAIHAGIGDVMVRVPDNVSVTVFVQAGIGDIMVFGEKREGLSVSLEKRIVVPDSAVELEIECRHAIGDVRIVHGHAAPRIIG